MKLFKKLDQNLEEWIMGVLLVGMALILMLQIIMRAFVGQSLTWAEELARYFYVGSVFLSLGCTIRKNNILRVDLLLQMLPVKLQAVVNVLLDLLNVVLFAYLCWYAVSTVQGVQVSGQTSPALEIPMYLIYWVIPIGFALASLRSLQKVYFDITGKAQGSETDPAEAL